MLKCLENNFKMKKMFYLFLKGFVRFPACTLSSLLWFIIMRCAGFMVPVLLCVFVNANALMYPAVSVSLSLFLF